MHPQYPIDVNGLVKEDRVHWRLYTDPWIFEEELRRIFGRVWVFVGHESEVPHPGDYKTTTIGRQPIIMSRHEDSKIHVMYNRCMHRGLVVCREEFGNSKYFRCIYHGWTYRCDGALSGVPFRSGYPPDLDFSQLGLMRLPRVATYRGFVFASLSPDGESLEEFLGPVIPYIDKILAKAPGEEIEVRCGVMKYEFFGNWKLQLENFLDHYHPPFTHESTFVTRRGAEAYQRGSLNQEKMDETEIRAFRHGHSIMDHPRWTPGQRPNRDPTEEYVAILEQRRGRERAMEILAEDIHIDVFPNLLFQQNSQSFRVVRPIAVDRTQVFVYPYRLKGVPEAMNKKLLGSVVQSASASGLMQPDDLEAFTRAQEGLQAEGPEWVLIARGVHHEKTGPAGERISSNGTDETALRAMYHYWKELMSDDHHSRG